jgi:hypothetical protein
LSHLDEQRIWFINDSGNRPELISLNYVTGKYRHVRVRGIKNRDWEDLESFNYRGEPWLLIGDVGDNRSKRGKVYLYLLPEPGDEESGVSVHTTIVVRYPDGATDVESLAVDPLTGWIYLLSKRGRVPQLYRLPLPGLDAGERVEVTAEHLGGVTSIPAPSAEEVERFPKYGEHRHWPTAMAFVPSGESGAIAVMTYRGVYLAPLDAERDWLRALNAHLCPVDTPLLAQGESVGADASGRLYVTSEGRRAPLYRLAPACAS